ncbi:hypothetical protein DFH08DRAFT_810619 [Mycena albidolilacea]|uniref:Uncharacterized protein n=1 Tax=Mycena albidolilacea TaxID=1033008 RepID=A0AAD7EQ82_9AGAR|nr:hypothetical protein DFH08DRAFT_810619 [Mycena albidolilacea]
MAATRWVAREKNGILATCATDFEGFWQGTRISTKNVTQLVPCMPQVNFSRPPVPWVNFSRPPVPWVNFSRPPVPWVNFSRISKFVNGLNSHPCHGSILAGSVNFVTGLNGHVCHGSILAGSVNL